MHVFAFVYEILCIVGSSKQLSALWSDQPFCRHWAVSGCAPLLKLGMHMSVSAICREACIC